MYTKPIHQQPIVAPIIMQAAERMKFTHDFAFSCYERLSSQRMKSSLRKLMNTRVVDGRPSRSMLELMMR